MKEIVIDGLVGAVTAAFGEGVESEELTESARAWEWEEDENPRPETWGRPAMALCAMRPDPGREVGALPH